jgi:hypothetical protein
MAKSVTDKRTVAALLLLLAAAATAPGVSAQSAVSEAEQRLFLDGHLANLPDKAAVRYDYAKTGTLEPTLEDRVRLEVEKGPQGRRTHVDYLTGDNAFFLPDIESANGNPVILSFLERDVREMERRTGGRANYFRRRVRLALAEDAQIDAVTVDLDGRPLEAVRISIRPYLDDPLKARFRAFAGKVYFFTICPKVPGMVYELRTEVRDAGAPPEAPPLVVEQVVYAGAEP